MTYSALVTARLGVPTAALMGVDALSEDAHELELLRAAGVDLRTVVLDRGPVFRNIERPEGRLQLSEGPSDAIPPAAIPEDWLGAPGWILAPVASELPDAWADAPSSEATVAVGWQGLLRDLRADAPVRHMTPEPGPIIARADIVGISRDDVDPSIPLDTLGEPPPSVGDAGHDAGRCRRRRHRDRRRRPPATSSLPARPSARPGRRDRRGRRLPGGVRGGAHRAATRGWAHRGGVRPAGGGDRRVAEHRGHRAVRGARPRGGPRTDARAAGDGAAGADGDGGLL